MRWVLFVLVPFSMVATVPVWAEQNQNPAPAVSPSNLEWRHLYSHPTDPIWSDLQSGPLDGGEWNSLVEAAKRLFDDLSCAQAVLEGNDQYRLKFTTPEVEKFFFLDLTPGNLGKGKESCQPSMMRQTTADATVGVGAGAEARWERSVNQYLLRAHRSYQRLKEWYDFYSRKTAAGASVKNLQVDAQRTLDGIDELLHQMMQQRGLKNVLSGILVAGPVIATDDSMAAKDATTASGFAHLRWESRHFGNETGRWDFSFGGKLGLQPALTLVAKNDEEVEEEEEEAEETEATTQQQQAFVWDLGLRFSRAIYERSEISFVPRIGQVHLVEGQTLFDKAEPPFVAIPLTSRTEWFGDVGITYKLFDNPLANIHPEGGVLSPVLEVSAGLRYDPRFKLEDEESNLVDFDKPESRYFFRFALNALKVIDRRNPDQEGKTFTVSFAVEHEGGAFGSTSPATTRFLITGDLDLLRAISGVRVPNES